MKHTKIAIIGVGAVGATTAYAMMLRNAAAELLLVDVNVDRTQGEAMDLADALSFSSVSTVKLASLEEAKSASIIVITAGAAQKPGETRIDLLNKNKAIVKGVFAELGELPRETIIIVATNPADVIALEALRCSELPASQVICSGTLLDSHRLRGFLARKIGVSAKSVHAYVLGEHGDSQFPAWSLSTIGGIPIKDLPEFDQAILDQYATETARKAYEIIDRKGATYYGVGACLASICKTIIYDKRKVLPISVYQPEHDIYLSVPVVLGERGVLRTMPLNLAKDEQEKLELSIAKLKQFS